MKKIFILTILLIMIISPAAMAEETTPILGNANIEINVDDSGGQITENITLVNVEGFENGAVEHILANLGDISDLAIMANGNSLDFELVEDETVNKVVVTIPDGIGNEFSYDITYTHSSEGTRIPLVVPSVNTDGNGNDVLLKITVPDGQYLHDSFPIIDGGDTGTLQEYMMNVPNFVNLEIKGSPPGFFTKSNLYTVFGLAVILGIIAVWVMNERKPKLQAGGDVHV